MLNAVGAGPRVLIRDSAHNGRRGPPSYRPDDRLLYPERKRVDICTWLPVFPTFFQNI